jgi:hypothetical protein
MKELQETARRYMNLEARVNEVVTSACQPVCRACIDCCCDVRFCRESINSHWLMTIAAVSGNLVGDFNEQQGWLSPGGCRLKVGRPPVCYEFFCEAIINGEHNHHRRKSLKILGGLVGFAGLKALGNRHLITLSQFEIQNRLRFEKLGHRLETAEIIFSECQEELCLPG